MPKPEEESSPPVFPHYRPPGIPLVDKAHQKPLDKMIKKMFKPKLKNRRLTKRWSKRHKFY